jgi:histidinol dehydrogenase
MTAVTARAAGVAEVCIATPRPCPEIVFAGALAGVSEFYRVGGAQAVAALALGTETVRPVDMIVGPGNAYVTEAKRQLSGRVGIDLIAGPSEILVVADAEADPRRAALDLLAQAEHDPLASAWLLTPDSALAGNVAGIAEKEAGELGLPDFFRPDCIAVLVLSSLEECYDAANRCSPEHLAVHVRDTDAARDALNSYGALFMGGSSGVAFGDYMAGPNHTLPTGRTARFQGGLNPMCFLRAQTWIEMGGAAEDLAEDTAAFADLEGLSAHAASARARGKRSDE